MHLHLFIYSPQINLFHVTYDWIQPKYTDEQLRVLLTGLTVALWQLWNFNLQFSNH